MVPPPGYPPVLVVNMPARVFRAMGTVPRIELQYSRIQDSRFKVPAQSFPRILNLESWIRGSIEVQSSGLNFNTRVLGLLES